MSFDRETTALRSQLIQMLKESPPAELEWLMSLLQAARRPMEEEILTGSDIVVSSFADDFGSRLRIFHALHDAGEVLTKKGFEYAFKGSSKAAGREAKIVDSATHAGADVIVDGISFSLKTEAAKGIRSAAITISKLMESAWTKDCTTVEDFFSGMHRVVTHLKQYERIVVLRAFGRLAQNGRVTYELVEIPCEVLLLIEDVRVNDFSPVTRAGGSTVAVRTSTGELAYSLVFDGSDQKITVRNLSKRLCTVHATWTILNERRRDLL
jgi:hypothetical protein